MLPKCRENVQIICVMLSGDGNAGEWWKTTIVLISKKATLHVQHTFFVHCLALFCTTTTWNFHKRFYGRNVVRVLVHFFSLPLTFSLHWWPLAFFILSPPLTNFHVLPTKKIPPLFFVSRSWSLSPFLSLSFAGLPPTFSFSLSFSCSIFQICGHENKSKLNPLDNSDTETISAFRFRLYWL